MGKLKKENEELKQKLQDVQALNEEHLAEHPSIGPSDFEGAPQPTHVTRNESNESNDEMIKQFTSIPKTLLEFYDQVDLLKCRSFLICLKVSEQVREQKEHILKEKPYMCLSLTLGELKNVSKNIELFLHSSCMNNISRKQGSQILLAAHEINV